LEKLVRSLNDIRAEIEALTEKRAQLLRVLSEQHDATLAAEHASLEAEIARLWEEHRIERARVRFGERDEIISRARHEERLERAA
jgi:hypothetical protein